MDDYSVSLPGLWQTELLLSACMPASFRDVKETYLPVV